MDDGYWSAVRSVRLGVADLLESLPAEDWDAPSLCREWRIRDVAGHLALVPTLSTWDLVAAAPHAGFNPHRSNTHRAIRCGSREREEILADLRAHAGDRRNAKVLDGRDSLFDVIVHSQDIAVPAGRDFAVPADYTSRGLQRVWDMGWPFHARRRLNHVTLRATDTEWTVGAGPEVAGTALDLLLLLTGRTATSLRRLEGAGVATLPLSARA
jgi:uncharacterized protein (TIGR03083 family)